MTEVEQGEIWLQGIGASPGICIGKAYMVDREGVRVVRRYPILPENLSAETNRFKSAVKKAKDELRDIIENTPDEYREHASILETHEILLKDKMLYGRTIETIEAELVNAEWALRKVVFDLRETFGKMSDPYFRDRIEDVIHVSQRIFRNLTGGREFKIKAIDKRVILVARELSPAETSQIQLERIKGFVTDSGGAASHTGIIARSLEIPAVQGVKDASRLIRNDDFLVVDGISGTVILHPSERTLFEYEERRVEWERRRNVIRTRARQTPAVTSDGFQFHVMANIELPEEVVAAKAHGANGIGLYRTEFQYLTGGVPSEEELLEKYREVAELMAPFPVTIRTLDINGDKSAAYLHQEEETNPALGFRAIRYCLRRPEIFRVQLRAILRAAAWGNIRVMFPMISSLEELIQARKFLREAASTLDRDGLDYNADIPVGIMLEVPSALLTVDVLAQHADFFSIGTNDLIQYTLAIDRGNRYVAHMFDPLHPAVIRLIHQATEMARAKRVKVFMCGEMASNPVYLPILMGMGIVELSMIPHSIPQVKNAISQISLKEAALFIDEVVRKGTSGEIRELLNIRYGHLAPDESSGYPGERGKG